LKVRAAHLECERYPEGVELEPGRIAVAVSNRNQKTMLRELLDRHGYERIVVNTANQLQGLEFDLVICWHPMAGLCEADQFHLEAGRLCVMCTRHRHACIVVGRQGDRELVEGVPPSTPTFPGAGPDTDEILRGWYIHGAVFAALESSRIPIH
jgi:hypothetical protein